MSCASVLLFLNLLEQTEIIICDCYAPIKTCLSKFTFMWARNTIAKGMLTPNKQVLLFPVKMILNDHYIDV